MQLALHDAGVSDVRVIVYLIRFKHTSLVASDIFDVSFEVETADGEAG